MSCYAFRKLPKFKQMIEDANTQISELRAPDSNSVLDQMRKVFMDSDTGRFIQGYADPDMSLIHFESSLEGKPRLYTMAAYAAGAWAADIY